MNDDIRDANQRGYAAGRSDGEIIGRERATDAARRIGGDRLALELSATMAMLDKEDEQRHDGTIPPLPGEPLTVHARFHCHGFGAVVLSSTDPTARRLIGTTGLSIPASRLHLIDFGQTSNPGSEGELRWDGTSWHYPAVISRDIATRQEDLC